jgi:hypothetical protein
MMGGTSRAAMSEAAAQTAAPADRRFIVTTNLLPDFRT